MMQVQLWMVLAAIALFFLIVSKLLFARALFATRVLQWAKHRKSTFKPEAAWVWRILLMLVLGIGIGELGKIGNPLLMTAFSAMTSAGLVLLALGLWTWVAAMDARKQYFWYFQVLAPREELPPYSTNGIYASVRNPRELGLLLVLAGLAASFGLLFTLACIVLLFLPATAFRVSSRDRVLIDKHGKAYIDYMHTSKRLIPHLY